MGFTNIDTVRQHLSQTAVAQNSFRDVAVPLTGSSAIALVHANILSGSIKVKGKEIGSPRFQTITLASSAVALSFAELIPDSVVVANNSSLGTIYTENVDYSVDYKNGKLSRIATGAITSGSTVAVWYYAYKIHSEGSDYAIDYVKGTIKRLTTGTIEDGQAVFVDYQIQGASFGDDQIANAINEADDFLLKLIDPAYESSADQGLITAETYLTLAILCRANSAAALTSSSVVGAAEISRSWRELAERYDTDGLKLAARFAAGKSGLQSPTAVSGGGNV